MMQIAIGEVWLMKIEKGVISSSQLMFLIVGLLQGSTLITSFISGVTKEDTWIVIVAGFLIATPLLFVYLKLVEYFPEKNIIQINDITYGRFLGKIISVIYIYHMWFIIAANLRFAADFFSNNLMEKTDITVFIIVIGLTVIYINRKGIEALARVVPLLVIITIIAAISIAIMLIGEYDIGNLFPMFQLNLMQFIQGTNMMTSIIYGEIVVFLMIFPCVRDKENIKKHAFLGLSIGSIYILLIILRNALVLGGFQSLDVQGSYQVAKLINIADIITRMEAIVAIILLFNLFVKISLLSYGTILGLAEIFKFRTYKNFASPIVIISMVFGITMFDSSIDQAYTGGNIYPIYGWIPEVVFPLVSLLIAKIRGLREEEDALN